MLTDIIKNSMKTFEKIENIDLNTIQLKPSKSSLMYNLPKPYKELSEDEKRIKKLRTNPGIILMQLRQKYIKKKLNHKTDSDELIELEAAIDEASYYNNIAIDNSIINYNNPEYIDVKSSEQCIISNFYHEYDVILDREIYEVVTDEDSDIDNDMYNNMYIDETLNN